MLHSVGPGRCSRQLQKKRNKTYFPSKPNMAKTQNFFKMHVWSSFQFLLKHWFWFHWFTLSSSEFLTKGSRQVLLTSKKYIQGGSGRGGKADSRSWIFGGKGPGSPRLGAVNLRFCYHQMSFPEAGFPCRQLTAVTEQKYSSENSKLPHRSEIVVLSPFLPQSSSSVLICTYLFLLKEKNNLQPPDNCFG